MDQSTSMFLAILRDASAVESMLRAMAADETDAVRRGHLVTAIAMIQSIHGRVGNELIVLEDEDARPTE